MRNFSHYVKLLSVIFILMLAVNTAILFFFFDVRLSDIADFATCSFRSARGDSSSEGDSSPEGDTPEGDSSPERDSSSEGDSSLKRDSSSEGDGSSERDSSAKGDRPLEGILEMAGIIDILNKLSFTDKITLAGIVARMGSTGLEKIYEVSKDGITSDELQKIREYAQAHLKPSDIAKLEDIFQRNRHLYADAGK